MAPDPTPGRASLPFPGVDAAAEEPTLTVEGPSPGEFRWVIAVSERRDRTATDEIIRRGLERVDTGSSVQLWIRDVDQTDDSAAERHGFVAYRDLWQLRCELPVPGPDIATRAFETDDLDDLVAVNNRAFQWHPEQGGRTAEELAEVMAEPWFEPDGLRLLHLDDRLAGFCWTKIHADHEPPLGEIYVIAVDPEFHGRGLGVPMTMAGLDWLGRHGLRHGMLYVESDNDAANATYRRIGFVHHRTDRAYRREPQP